MRSLLQPDQIWYGGLVRAESAMRIMSDIGSKLTHTFQVTNDGPWHVEDFNVLIEWPHRLVTSTQPLGKENREFLVKSAQKFFRLAILITQNYFLTCSSDQTPNSETMNPDFFLTKMRAINCVLLLKINFH